MSSEYKSPVNHIRPYNIPWKLGPVRIYGWPLLILLQSVVVLMLGWFILTGHHRLLYIMCEAVSLLVLAGLPWQWWSWYHEKNPSELLYDEVQHTLLHPDFHGCVVCSDEVHTKDVHGFTDVELGNMCAYHYHQFGGMRNGG